MKLSLSRRGWLAATLFSAGLLAACAGIGKPPTSPPRPPIVFVHGNGDNAGLWLTTMWRFESNGWPRERLHAIDLPYPLARDDDTKPQEGRTSTAEHMAYLAGEVDKVLARTGARQVVLMGNSRGGNAIRNYIANGGGADKVSHAILGGVPNHGVWADAVNLAGSEFNGAGAFLTGLNAPKGPRGDEVTAGVRWMTIRSDGNDKYAQPDGAWIGRPGTPTHVSAEGPALRGAENIVIPGIDHRETAFSAQAFAHAYRFITATAPATLAITPEKQIVLDGKVSGLGLDNAQGAYASNLPLVGATVEVYAVDGETAARSGPAAHRKTVGADGRWGPFRGDSLTRYEFVIAAPGYATTHIYRSPFPRSSDIVNLRPERLAEADKSAGAVVTLVRPRGYFGVPRDRISLDGKSPPAGIPTGVPGVASAKLRLGDAGERAVVGEFNGERIVGRSWPQSANHLVVLELHE